MMRNITYKNSGVDIKKADGFVRSIQGLMKQTMNAGVLKKQKAFCSFFVLDIKKYRNPVLVSSTDGVGTKLLIAKHSNKHDTVGIDLVAMNTNDVLCSGARPLFFLDYIACGKVRPNILKDVVYGISRGCQLSGCSLIGGETAEMPGLYEEDEYDLAGFAVGIVEKNKIIDGATIQVGDTLIGIASNGLHSNGFSLVRKIFSLSEQKRLGAELLRPTKIYVKPVLELIKRFHIKGIAHMTGGAFYQKLTKIIPTGKCCHIIKGSWPIPNIFKLIQKKGRISNKEMYTTFNMGIGMILVVRPKDSAAIRKFLSKQNLKSWEIGTIIKDNKRKIIFS